MRALTELLTVFVAAFFGFFALVASLIGTVVGFLVIAVAGFFSAASLLIALFAGVMFTFTGKHHDAVLAVGYSLYAAGAFAVVVVMLFYRDMGLTRFRGHPEAFARGAPDAQNPCSVYA